MKKAILAILAAVTAWILWANTAIEINEWVIASTSVPEAFDGFRIAQVSDLHNTEFGTDNETLLTLLEQSEPDIIVLTGDLIDSRNTDIGIALSFVEKAVKIAPCFYVTGNHESRIAAWPELRQGLLDAGVTVLEDEKVKIERGVETVTLIGLSDPDFRRPFAENLRALTAGEEGYTILLSHRPESFGLYVSCGVDLVFSGHAHGGQVRIPFLGGLVAPHQGFFPTYDSGLYRDGGTAMLVSRGLGNSILPLRINNRPELVLVILECI
ncbi:MAG: metallophosphoesterase [Ruminococcaceae bacterium]|nr:metallophosphoesterase [Oscillospiraceae bacterium]